MVWFYDDSDPGPIIQEAAAARFAIAPNASKIKPLWQKPSAGSVPEIKSAGSRHLHDPLFLGAHPSPEEVEQLVREHYPRLRHVRYQNWDGAQNNQQIIAFLRGCSGLQSFVAEHFDDRRRLRYSSQVLSSTFEPRLILSDVTSLHCSTLETFELRECTQVSSQDLQAILFRCKQLKRFIVMYNGMARKPGIDFTDVVSGDWVCLGLRELTLRLNRDLNPEETSSPEEFAQATKRIYTQIGRLHQLEVLALEVDGFDRTEETGDCSWDLTLSQAGSERWQIWRA
ncbi:hypothetical protein BGZ70_003781 [Mortierella alpina]|uniref:Uncharacterized protein n=1 Tax=Mortierella alpina TaxID=64518 RepID=A0A9P6JDQ9_MORAP|nr:hypothetical protein BGZ70_003781 [Mortierella alpina]